MSEQLLLFEEPLEYKLLREIKELKESVSKVRKGQFAKISDLTKMYKELYEDLEIIKAGLCKNELQVKSSCEIFELALM